jgi:ABC-type glycerol-3-phosphate transport system substrate-binding protein
VSVPRPVCLSRRRLLGGAASLVGGAAAVAGCGAGTGASGEESGGGAAAPTRVRVLIRQEYEGPAWAAFNAATKDVQVDTEPGTDITREYGARILTLAAAGSAPDVIYTHPNFFSSLAATKLLADVERLATRARFDLKGIQGELLDSVRWNGTLYALPYGGVANVVVYNAGQFQRRGVALPNEQARAGRWTWETFRESLLKLTLRAPEQPPEVGMPQHFSGMQYLSQWVFAGGGQVWSADLKSCLLSSPPATAALDLLARLHHQDQVAIQPGERDAFGGNAQEGFPTGRVGLRFRATTELHFYRQMAEEGARLGLAPVPRGPAGGAPRGAANSWGIWSGSMAIDAAWKAAAAWHSDPVLEVLFAGRFGFPCRQSHLDHPAFKAALFPWEDPEVERAALRDVKIMATPARQTEIDDLWVRLWPQARDGRRTVPDLLGEFLPQANALLV